jgi:hypothetical protein
MNLTKDTRIFFLETGGHSETFFYPEDRCNRLLRNNGIVTHFIKVLPGNSSVNSPTYTGGQQYGRIVFYVVRAATVDFYY